MTLQEKEDLSLTEKQTAYVSFIKKFWIKKGYGPSEQEIANHFLISTPSVHMMIVKLCAIGVLNRTE